MGSKEFQKYTHSKNWKKLKFKIIERDGRKCTECASKPLNPVSLIPHHITYERVGHEFLEDLITLCRDCHSKVDHSTIPFIERIKN